MSLTWEQIKSPHKNKPVLSIVLTWLAVVLVTGWWSFIAVRFVYLAAANHGGLRWLSFVVVAVAIVLAMAAMLGKDL